MWSVRERPQRGTRKTFYDPRRDAENCNCNTFCPRRATEGHGELQLQKGNCNTFCPRRATEGHGELQLQKGNCNTFCPRRDVENTFF